MSFSVSKGVLLALALVALCNNTMSGRSSSGAQAQLLADRDQQLGLIGSRQLSFVPEVHFEDAGLPAQLAGRFRRQVSYPQGSPLVQQPQQPQPAQSEPNPLGFLSQLGPQLAQAKSISQLFSSSSGSQQQQQQQPGEQSGAQTALNAATLMGQLSELVRSTQDRSKQLAESTRQNVQSAGQATQQAAQNAQGGIQSALADIGAGLQRIAANNPNLLPDVKSLYQSVSGKLNSASSSVAQSLSPVPSGQQQFAQGVASQIANPQPIPSPAK